MSGFLQQAAQHILRNYRDSLHEICIVLPNRRAGLYLSRFLAAQIKEPVWSPVHFSIEDFMGRLSGLQEVSQVHLLAELYKVHRQIAGAKAQPFDEFLTWGVQLLADLNDVDRYMADSPTLFSYLSEVRALNLWNLDKTPLSDFQKQYLGFYQSLGMYHQLFSTSLLERREGYQGLVFRQAAIRLEAGEVSIPWKKVIFAGFNALTTAEERVIDQLVSQGVAELLWDADRYYLDQPHQEAGHYLRKWISRWPQKEPFKPGNGFGEGEKTIEVVGISDLAGQAKFCGELLRQFGEELKESTAIVLPDEKLLMPLLNSIPAGGEALNVTMGLPLNMTPLAGLLELVVAMHLNPNSSHSAVQKVRFYFRDVVKVLKHPLIMRLGGRLNHGDLFVFNELITKISNGGKVYLAPADLSGSGLFQIPESLSKALFEPWRTTGDAIARLLDLVGLIREPMPENRSMDGKTNDIDPVEREYAYSFSQLLGQLRDLIESDPTLFTLQTLSRFLRQLTSATSLPFYGQPLQGLQIMGMLETRTLDFDNLILLSCNEGLLPSGRTAHSFIPFDIRRDFGLPTYSQRDAVYAYHFYRLLQRAKRIWLLYSTEPEDVGSGDKSRFIQQILQELPSWNPRITIRERLAGASIPAPLPVEPIVIEKKGDILRRLEQKAVKGVAPTALNNYRRCSFLFYLSDIAAIREPDEATDTIDSRMMGTCVHRALHLLYSEVLNQPLDMHLLQRMKKGASAAVDKAFAELFEGDALAFGKNLLLVNVARLMVERFIGQEMDDLTHRDGKDCILRVALLEQHLRRTMKISCGEKELDVLFKGFIDRVDYEGGIARVIDYKTGGVDPKELKVGEWPELLTDPRLDKSFQLLTYVWLLRGNGRHETVRAGVIPLKTLSRGFMALEIGSGSEAPEGAKGGKKRGGQAGNQLIGDQEMAAFEELLLELTGEIFNPEVPFRQTDDITVCESCRYRTICAR